MIFAGTIHELPLQAQELPDTLWSKAIDDEHIANVVKFSPDGQYLFAGYGNDIIQIEISTGEIIRTLSYHKGYVTQIGFSPSGDTLISSGWDGRIVLWDYHSGDSIECISLIKEIKNSAKSNALITPDGKRIITLTEFIGFDEPQILIIDVETKEIIKSFVGRYYYALNLQVSPDGKYFSFVDFRGTFLSIVLIDLNTYEEIKIFNEDGKLGDLQDNIFSNDNGII